MENQLKTIPKENPVNLYGTKEGFELIQRQALAISKGTMIPTAYQGNMANCMIAIEMAHRMAMSPFMVMQNLQIIQGSPGWKSEYVISKIETCGKFKDVDFEFFGNEGTDSWGCRLKASRTRDGRELVSERITIAMAKSEGWYHRKGSKWPNMPRQMLMYRAAAFFSRINCPEILNGVRPADEIIDIPYTEDVAHTEVTNPNDDLKRTGDDETII